MFACILWCASFRCNEWRFAGCVSALLGKKMLSSVWETYTCGNAGRGVLFTTIERWRRWGEHIWLFWGLGGPFQCEEWSFWWCFYIWWEFKHTCGNTWWFDRCSGWRWPFTTRTSLLRKKKRSKKRHVYISRRKYRLYMSRARRLVADFFSLWSDLVPECSNRQRFDFITRFIAYEQKTWTNETHLHAVDIWVKRSERSLYSRVKHIFASPCIKT